MLENSYNTVSSSAIQSEYASNSANMFILMGFMDTNKPIYLSLIGRIDSYPLDTASTAPAQQLPIVGPSPVVGEEFGPYCVLLST